jgi:transcriptional regulator with XRE-family HTH domain
MGGSFGETLALLRRRHGVRQQELVTDMGWANPSTLSRIESGRTPVDRDLAERLSDALALPPQERALLLAAGAIVPDEQDVALALAAVQPYLDALPHPASLIDFRWVLHAINAAYCGQALDPDALARRVPGLHLIELFADTAIVDAARYVAPPWDGMLASMVGQFRAQHRFAEDAPWFRDIARRVLRFPVVRAHWDGAATGPPRPLTNVGFARISGDAEYMLVSSPLSVDPRFEFVQFVPLNDAARARNARQRERGAPVLASARGVVGDPRAARTGGMLAVPGPYPA